MSENTNEEVVVDEDLNETSDGHETVETTVDGHEDGNDNDNESGEKVNEKPKFEPWKIQKEKKITENVPYDRFREVNSEKNEYARKIAELEDQLSKYTKREDELSKIKTPDDIKIDDYDDPQEYLKARDTAIKNQAIMEVEERFIAREQERIQKEKNEQITNQYVANLEKSFAKNPEIKEAVEWFDGYANQLHADVAYELLVDENVGEIIYKCATDQDLLKMLFKGDPKDVIRKIHKMSALIDAQPSQSPSKRTSNEESNVPKAMEKKIGVPTVIKGGKSPTKKLEDMSMDEYRKYVRKRDKR